VTDELEREKSDRWYLLRTSTASIFSEGSFIMHSHYHILEVTNKTAIHLATAPLMDDAYHYLIRRSGALLVGQGLSQATYITSNPYGVTLWKKPDGRTISIDPDAWRNG